MYDALHAALHSLAAMGSAGCGSIVNISSTYGHEGAAGASVYAASKHAVEGMTKSAALEAAASGVRVNAVAPGPIDTGMLNRFTGTAEAKAALASGVPRQNRRLTEFGPRQAPQAESYFRSIQ